MISSSSPFSFPALSRLPFSSASSTRFLYASPVLISYFSPPPPRFHSPSFPFSSLFLFHIITSPPPLLPFTSLHNLLPTFTSRNPPSFPSSFQFLPLLFAFPSLMPPSIPFPLIFLSFVSMCLFHPLAILPFNSSSIYLSFPVFLFPPPSSFFSFNSTSFFSLFFP